MIMTIEEYVKRKVRPKEGDILIIQGVLYQVVNSGQNPGDSEYCGKCHLDGERFGNKECIYSFIEGVYISCAEFIDEPYVLKRVRKKFNGL